MNKQREEERLLDEVLANDFGKGFHDALLVETLRSARQRRRRERARRTMGLLARVVAAAMMVWRSGSHDKPAPEITQTPPLPPPIPSRSYRLIIDEPLAPSQIVTTVPFAAAQRVVSVDVANVVRTATGGYREITDDELLALLAPEVVALVQRGPHQKELVFVNASKEGSAAAAAAAANSNAERP